MNKSRHRKPMFYINGVQRSEKVLPLKPVRAGRCLRHLRALACSGPARSPLRPRLAIDKHRRCDIKRRGRRLATILDLSGSLGILLRYFILQAADARTGIVAGERAALRGGLARGRSPSDANAEIETCMDGF